MKYLPLLTQSNYWGDLVKPPGKMRNSYVSRLMAERETNNVSAVLGVRRAGKSTILKQAIFRIIEDGLPARNTLLINLEDPRIFELLTENRLFELVTEFKEQADLRSPQYLVLDEVQNLQNWEAIVRTLLDQEPKMKIYITGSSAHLLDKELSTKLAGRFLKTEVFPLSYREFIQFKSNNPTEFLSIGGFPDPVLTKNELIRDQLLKDYYDSIILRDVAARYNIGNDFKLRRLASQLFSNISNQASSYRLSRDIDVSADTILQYFSYIADAYLGFFVPKYSPSVRKQTYNPKKFYSIDTGLQEAVAFRVFDDLGKLFENAVFLELRRLYRDIYYWEEEKEVDFVVKEKEHVKLLINASVALENKKTFAREVGSLMEAMHYFKKKESILVILQGKEETIDTEVGAIEVKLFENLFGSLDHDLFVLERDDLENQALIRKEIAKTRCDMT